MWLNRMHLLVMVGNRGVDFRQKLRAIWFPKNDLRKEKKNMIFFLLKMILNHFVYVDMVWQGYLRPKGFPRDCN